MVNETSKATQKVGKPLLELKESGVAFVRLGEPDERVVTLTATRMFALREILLRLRETRPRGVIFIGPHVDMFTAGADISVIREVTDPKVGETLAKEGQSLFDEIESLPFPTLAAISGPCVGGGCELVLACSRRIISDQKSSSIGLPEVKLGILPGFGGTQRLPRLIGLPKALDIILGGKTLRPKQALAYGLVDEIIAPHKLEDRAESVILDLSKLKTYKLPFSAHAMTFTSLGRKFVAKKAREEVRLESKGFYPAPPAALDAVLYGLEHGKLKGLENEAKELGRLIVTPECKSLVKIFFLTEASKSIGKGARKSVEHVHALVVGAGTMGAGIAGILAKNEASVILKDTSEESVARGVAHIKKYLASLKYLNETERSFIANRIEPTTRDSASMGNATLAIEAIFEDMAQKKKVLSEAAKQMPQDAILASNTSSLSITEIAKEIPNPERVVGMHFFNPVEKMPLVEIIRGAQTSDKTIVVIAALATKLGKYPIVVKDVPGFLINRILSPYLNEAAFLLEDGYAVEDIDKVALEFGMPMGPVRLLDEVGLDVVAHVGEVMVKGYGPRMQGPTFAATLVAAGRKGKKSGGGFYQFSNNGRGVVKGQLVERPFHGLRGLLKLQKPERKSEPRVIIDRLLMALVNEAIRCLDEGVAGAPGPDAAQQIDLGTVMGMGFPPFRGGLLHYADSIGAEKVLASLQQLEKECGSRFTPAPGITTRIRRNKKFSDKV